MKVVAFLQNQWFKRMGPDDHPHQIRRKAILDANLLGPSAEVREQHVKDYLFMGCETGKRLVAHFDLGSIDTASELWPKIKAPGSDRHGKKAEWIPVSDRCPESAGLFDSIVWEEVSRDYGWVASHRSQPQWDHIQDVLVRHKPDVVMLFGKAAAEIVARPGLRAHLLGFDVRPEWIVGPHPAGRDSGVKEGLIRTHQELREAHDRWLQTGCARIGGR